MRPGDPGWGLEPAGHRGLLGVGEDAVPVETEPGSYERFYEGVAKALREGAPLPVAAAEALIGIELLEKALA